MPSSRITLVLSLTIGTALPSLASAQTAEAPQEGPPATTPPGPPAPSPAPSPATAAPPPPTSPSSPAWYDAIAFDAFVDAYGSINYNFPKPQAPTSGFGGNQFRAFDVTQGLAINWVGVNASYAPDPVGGTVSLRFGPGARLYAGNDAQIGLENVKQAFASWKPGGKESAFTIDFGKYDQPYGSEVAETQLNMNYSRSALFNYAQPLFFTGLRLDWQATQQLDLKLIAANGWNNSVSPNRGKTVGVQVNFKPSDTVLLSAGYAVGPQQPDATVGPAPGPGGTPSTVAVTDGPGSSSNLKHLVDAIVDVTFDKVRLLANADFGAEETPAGANAKWYGVNLGVRYAISDPFGVAVRGEWFADPDGWATQTLKKGTTLVDGTVTLDWTPAKHLVLRLEQRLDAISDDAGDALFQKKTSDTAKTQMTTLLGVVVKTN